MIKIKWFNLAIDDLQMLRQYVAQDNPPAAKQLANKIQKSILFLSENPHIGRFGRITGTRELIVSGTPYIIPYRVKNNTIEILRVLHGARQWPERL